MLRCPKTRTSCNISARLQRARHVAAGLIPKWPTNPRTASACGPWSRGHLARSLAQLGYCTSALRLISRLQWKSAGGLQDHSGGQGFATEAARVALQFGFQEVRLPKIVAHASNRNLRSHRVMAKLGMSYDSADAFDHPPVAEGDSIRRQVLYRLTRDTWLSQGALSKMLVNRLPRCRSATQLGSSRPLHMSVALRGGAPARPRPSAGSDGTASSAAPRGRSRRRTARWRWAGRRQDSWSIRRR